MPKYSSYSSFANDYHQKVLAYRQGKEKIRCSVPSSYYKGKIITCQPQPSFPNRSSSLHPQGCALSPSPSLHPFDCRILTLAVSWSTSCSFCLSPDSHPRWFICQLCNLCFCRGCYQAFSCCSRHPVFKGGEDPGEEARQGQQTGEPEGRECSPRLQWVFSEDQVLIQEGGRKDEPR